FNISVASPGQAGQYALQMDANIAANSWGGVGKYFSAAQNWSTYNHMDFWFYGSNTGSVFRVEILDNRAAGSTTDTSERFEYRFTDKGLGGRHSTLPWSAFTRRADWQPAGAPNDGFTTAAIWGLNFALTSGQGSFRMDEIKLAAP